MRQDTIVATSSAPGASPLGIVRLSGPAAFGVAASLLVPHPGERSPERRLVAGELALPRAPLPAHVLFFPAPRSATGEDVAEIRTVGSPPIQAWILRECVRRGARLAEPGEFTRRAFLEGRIDLLQAEAVADLVAAETAAEAERAAPFLRGLLGRRIEALKSSLLDAAARVEARLDFPEDEVPELEPEEVEAPVRAALEETALLLGGAPLRVTGGDEPVVALAGAPNAGKSTLFNALLGTERAIVSAVAGTTRDAVVAPASLHGRRVLLADTAGLGGEAISTPVDALAQARTRESLESARLVLGLVDLSRPPSAEHRAFVLALGRGGSAARGAVLAVGTKADLPADPLASALLEAAAARFHPGRPAVRVAALRGERIDRLRAAIAAALDAAEDRSAPGGVVAARQRSALRAARASLRRARVHLARRSSELDLLASDLRDAAVALGELTGSVRADDILDRVFARFCIGK